MRALCEMSNFPDNKTKSICTTRTWSKQNNLRTCTKKIDSGLLTNAEGYVNFEPPEILSLEKE